MQYMNVGTHVTHVGRRCLQEVLGAAPFSQLACATTALVFGEEDYSNNHC